nr:hypothetical protein CFP56_69142 [Quercus suber]
MPNSRNSLIVSIILLWSAFRPTLKDSDNFNQDTTPSPYFGTEVLFAVPPTRTSNVRPLAESPLLIEPSAGQSANDVLEHSFLDVYQDETVYWKYDAYALVVSALFALMAYSLSLNGRAWFGRFADKLPVTTNMLLNQAITLKLAIGDRMPIAVCNLWDLTLQCHPYSADLLDIGTSYGIGMDMTTSIPRAELAKTLVSVLAAAIMLLILSSWYASKSLRQSFVQYLSLYRRYESVSKLNQEARTTKDQIIADKAAYDVFMQDKLNTAVSRKQDLESEKRDLEEQKRCLESELAVARSDLRTCDRSEREEVQRLEKKLKSCQDRLVEVEFRKETENENLALRVKELESRRASDAVVARNEDLSLQVEWLQNSVKNLKSKNFDLTVNNYKLRNSTRSNPTSMEAPATKNGFGLTVDRGVTTIYKRQSEELEDAKKTILGLEQQIQHNATADNTSSAALAHAKTEAVTAQDTLRIKAAEVMQLQNEEVKRSEDLLRSTQKIEELEEHIATLTQTCNILKESVHTSESTCKQLLTELRDRHAESLNRMKRIAELEMQKEVVDDTAGQTDLAREIEDLKEEFNLSKVQNDHLRDTNKSMKAWLSRATSLPEYYIDGHLAKLAAGQQEQTPEVDEEMIIDEPDSLDSARPAAGKQKQTSAVGDEMDIDEIDPLDSAGTLNDQLRRRKASFKSETSEEDTSLGNPEKKKRKYS